MNLLEYYNIWMREFPETSDAIAITRIFHFLHGNLLTTTFTHKHSALTTRTNEIKLENIGKWYFPRVFFNEWRLVFA